jgi:hypothetical protein
LSANIFLIDLISRISRIGSTVMMEFFFGWLGFLITVFSPIVAIFTHHMKTLTDFCKKVRMSFHQF